MREIGDSEYAQTYVLSMRDAHRKPYQSIRAPALTRHLVFRKTLLDVESEEAWVTRIEATILRCLIQLQKCGSGKVRVGNFRGTPVLWGMDDPVQLLRNSYIWLQRRNPNNKDGKDWLKQEPISGRGRYETVNIEASWRKLGLVMRFELFEEYFTCSTTLELRLDQSFAKQHNIDDAELKTSAPARALDFLARGWRKDFVRATSSGNSQTAEEINAASSREEQLTQQRFANGKATRKVTRTIWKAFDREVLTKAFTASERVMVLGYAKRTPGQLNGPYLRAEPPDEIVAHFTGLVLALDSRADPNGTIRGAGLDTPQERQLSHAGRSIRPNMALVNGGAETWAGVLFPFLVEASEVAQNIPLGTSERSPFETSEYTWSTFDGSRCLYGSGFGPQGDSGAPLQYVMLLDHDEHRAIGRAVHRLHTLGTLRLAALFDADRAIRHSDVLANLDREITLIDNTHGIRELAKRQWIEWESLERECRRLAQILDEERGALTAAIDRKFHTFDGISNFEPGLLESLVQRGHALLHALEERKDALREADLQEEKNKERANRSWESMSNLRTIAGQTKSYLASWWIARQTPSPDRIEIQVPQRSPSHITEELTETIRSCANKAARQRDSVKNLSTRSYLPRDRVSDRKITDRQLLSDTFPRASEELLKCGELFAALHQFAVEHSELPVKTRGVTAEDVQRWSRIKTQTQHVCRIFGRLDKARTAKKYREVLLEDIENALQSIQSSPLQGEPLRSLRTKYYLERWKNIANGADIGKVIGYQSYSDFVEHRLERVYSLILQVAGLFEAVTKRADTHRKELDREVNRNRIKRIELLQVAGEFVLLLFLAPYYLGHVISAIFHTHETAETAVFIVCSVLGLFAWVVKTLRERHHEADEQEEVHERFALWSAMKRRPSTVLRLFRSSTNH